jgi:hypothetical protein
MARYIELPDGSALELKEGQSPVEGMMAARQLFPELFKKEEKPKEDTKGFKAAAAAGFERLKGETALTAAKLGLKDIGEAEAYQKEKQASAARRFTPTEDSFIASPLQNVKELLGGSVPYMLAPAAAGLAALAAPVSAPVAAGLGLLGAGAVSTGQFTGSNLARQMDTGKSLEETSLGKAAAAAVPQALIDTAAMALLPGVGKLFGSVGSKLTTEQAKAIASQTLTRTIADYTAKTGVAMGREGITEATQQVLERLQAGLELDSPEARKEYIDSFIGGAVLGGVVAPAGRAFERGGAKRQAAEFDRAEDLQRRSEQAQQQKTQDEAAAKALEEERQSPEYAKSVAAQYDALQKQKQDLIAQKRKIVDASPTADADRAFNAELNQQLKTVAAEIKPLAGEYNRVQPIIQQEAEKARVAGMSPEEYMLEQTQTVPDTKTKAVEPDLGGLYEQQITSPSDALGTYAKSRLDLARDQVAAPDVKDYVDYLMQDVPTARRLVETRTQLPGLKAAEQRAVFGGIDLQLKALEKQRIAAGRAGTGAAQQRLSAVEEEEQATLDTQRAEDARVAEETARRDALAPEVAALQGMATKPSPMIDQFSLFEGQPNVQGSAAMGQAKQQLLDEEVTATAEENQADVKRDLRRVPGADFKLRARKEGTAPVTRDEVADRLNRVLSTYELSPEASAFLRRAEQAMPQADTTLKQETSGEANREDIKGEIVKDLGTQKNVSQSDSFFTLLNAQLDKIESGAEGVPRKGQNRTLTTATEPATAEQLAQASTTPGTEGAKIDMRERRDAQPGQPSPLKITIAQPAEAERSVGLRGQADQAVRTPANQPTTLRGASAKAADLSLQGELEPLVSQSERAADEQAGQLSLFPEEQKKLGYVKPDREAFNRFMRSPFVNKLRKALRANEETLKQAARIPALKNRVKELTNKVIGVLSDFQEYKTADKLVRANRDIQASERGLDQLKSVMTKNVVDRMELSGAIESLQQQRAQFLEESQQTGIAPDAETVAQLENVERQMQQFSTDLALIDGAMNTLDGQIRVAQSQSRMLELVDKAPSLEDLETSKTELRAAQTELADLQQRINALETEKKTKAAEDARTASAVAAADRAKALEPLETKASDAPIQGTGRGDLGATVVPAMSWPERVARRWAARGKTPISATEKQEIQGNPEKVLGGFKAIVTALEKKIYQNQQNSKRALETEVVGPAQTARDTLDAQYKAAKSSAERATIGEKLDAAESALTKAREEGRKPLEEMVWKSKAGDTKKLAQAMRKVDWLESLIAEGRVEVAPPKSVQVISKKNKEILTAETKAKAQAVGTERLAAPATSGEALTRTEAKEAAQPQKTQYEGKGVPGGTAKEISRLTGPEIFESMQKLATDKGRANDIAFRTVTRGPTSLQTEQVERLAERITKGWVNAPEIVVVATEADLPVRIRGQIVKADRAEGTTPGLFDTKTKKVYLIASNLSNANDVILTLAHEAAGHYGLRELLGNTYTSTMNSLYRGNPEVRKQADAKLKEDKSLSREVAVEEVLAEMAEDPNPTPAEKSALRQIYERLRAWLRSVISLPNITDAEVQQLVANARRFVIEGGVAGEGQAPSGEATYRTKAAAEPDNALIELSRQITTQPKTFKEKLGSNLALQAEMNAVDMRAGLRDTLKFGDDKLFTQAMYHVRKAEQKMAQMFTVMNSGPLVAYKDSKGFVGYRSSNENSARDVFDAISDIPVSDPQLKTNIAQAYMVAQRAANKGLSKLDLGELGITQEQLTAALAAADADPALKRALESVRTKYNAYNKGMIEFLASTGRITKKVAADLLKDGDYVPYYRVQGDNAILNFGNNVSFNVGDIRRQPYLAELKGGQTKLLPLNEALQQNTLLLTDMALTNNAAKSVAYGLQALGKGMGPVDPDTGKPTSRMVIKTGLGPANASTIRFYQEPDPNNPKDTGERHLVVDTKGTAAEGIPAELVVQSLEGASLALPGFLKLGGAAADLLRAGVTRTPLYIARKLLREPMAAAFTGGLNENAFSAVFKAGAEFVRMSRGTSDAQAKLIEKGLIQSNIFAGDMSDMKKMAIQLASGKDQGALDKVIAAADRYAMRADAATLALVLKNAEANGLSEVEADMATMESMNFYKRGLSPTLQYASRLIPFFNAQIQGLNVLYKAARGQMPFEEQQQIKRKFFNNAMLLMATGLVYAMAMEDDETFRNARPRDKYANFFLPIPGVDEPLKLPIPFEAGYFFSLAVAAVDGMRAETDGKAQFQALRDLFLGSVPGYSSMGIPALVKPAFEVWTDKNFLTGGPIEPRRMQGYATEERYLATTTELAKQMSKLLPILSPIQIEHIVRGYLGVLPLAAAAGANGLFERAGKGESPAGRASDLPLIGTAFQKKYGGGDADVVYREAQEAVEASSTFKKILSEGRREEAAAYRDKNKVELALAPAAGQYRQIIGRINTDIRRTQERDDLTAEEKRLRLDALDKAKQDRADAFIRQSRLVEERLGGGGGKT